MPNNSRHNSPKAVRLTIATTLSCGCSGRVPARSQSWAVGHGFERLAALLFEVGFNRSRQRNAIRILEGLNLGDGEIVRLSVLSTAIGVACFNSAVAGALHLHAGHRVVLHTVVVDHSDTPNLRRIGFKRVDVYHPPGKVWLEVTTRRCTSLHSSD